MSHGTFKPRNKYLNDLLMSKGGGGARCQGWQASEACQSQTTACTRDAQSRLANPDRREKITSELYIIPQNLGGSQLGTPRFCIFIVT